MPQPRPLIVGLLAVTFSVAACSTDDRAAPPGPSTRSTTTTVAAITTTTTAPTTTIAAPITTTTTAAPTTTTTTVPTIDIDGSPMIEFSVAVDEEALEGRLSEPELVSFVVETLSDRRSWIGRGVGFRLVEDGGLFTITVATPERTDELCWPLRTNGRFSCARNGWIVFNSDRWFGATDTWPADLETYRRYLVNHEVGHYILGPGHPGCPGAGLRAPIMMQQTKGLGGCLANGWVDP